MNYFFIFLIESFIQSYSNYNLIIIKLKEKGSKTAVCNDFDFDVGTFGME